MSLFQLVAIAGVAGVALSAVMAVAWCLQARTGNAGWIDVLWTFGVGVTAISVALLPLSDALWLHARQTGVVALAAVWVLRLGIGKLARACGAGDDPRYRQLINSWGAGASRRLFWLGQAQAAAGVILVLSVALAAHNPDPNLRILDVLGSMVLVGAIAGAAAADEQLRRFKAAHAHVRAVCDIGLWRWSRHPNFFFEWMAWLGYPLLAIDPSGQNPYGWISLLGPLCMYWGLVAVSGIRPLEQHMIRSRGDAYRRYQRRTSRFFPIPPSADDHRTTTPGGPFG